MNYHTTIVAARTALSSDCSRLSLETLPYTDWTTYLHLLVGETSQNGNRRKRADLRGDRLAFYPAI
jgi:hypothetical protein